MTPSNLEFSIKSSIEREYPFSSYFFHFLSQAYMLEKVQRDTFKIETEIAYKQIQFVFLWGAFVQSFVGILETAFFRRRKTRRENKGEYVCTQ